jgi:SAM-dependent methyltransferase
MSKNKKSKNRLCPVCSGKDILQVITIKDVPVYCNVLYSTAEEAVNAPRGNIVLNYCPQCGHIFNSAYESGKMDYSQEYENSLHYSACFQEYALSLAKRLVEAYDLHGKRILEIGCGKGDFLNMLCELGENTGIGFDPSYQKDRFPADSLRRFSVINDFYSEKYADYKADLIVCRQVLEHIEAPRTFVSMLRQSTGSNGNTILFFEVPNIMFTLKDLGIWDLIYEHCGYFSEASLSYLFASCGFGAQKIGTDFGGQYIGIEASALQGPSDYDIELMNNTDKLISYVKSFSDNYHRKVSEWKNIVEEFENGKKKAVVWGAGSKGVTFLNVLGLKKQIKYIVDINPHKQSMYVPGTGQMVIPPGKLQDIHPDFVIAMNPLYIDEIRKMIAVRSLSCKVLVN